MQSYSVQDCLGVMRRTAYLKKDNAPCASCSIAYMYATCTTVLDGGNVIFDERKQFAVKQFATNVWTVVSSRM